MKDEKDALQKPSSKNTEDFLKHFPGNQIFVSKTDGQGLDKNKPTPPPIHYHSEFQGCSVTLHKQEAVLWGTFFTVNELDRALDPGRQRTSKMVTRVRAVWVEDDKKRKSHRTDFPITPNIVVNSSPGKYHYYWLTSTKNFDEWNGVMATLVDEYGCDDNAKDLARILRLPGFNHNKAEPHLVTFEVKREEPYPWVDILRNFPFGDYEDTKKSCSSGKTGSAKSGVPKKTRQEHIQAVITGDNFHGSFQSIAASMANETQSKPTILQHLRGIAVEAYYEGDFSSFEGDELRERRGRIKSIIDDDTELEGVVDWAVDRTIEEKTEKASDSGNKRKSRKYTEPIIPKYSMGNIYSALQKVDPEKHYAHVASALRNLDNYYPLKLMFKDWLTSGTTFKFKKISDKEAEKYWSDDSSVPDPGIEYIYSCADESHWEGIHGDLNCDGVIKFLEKEMQQKRKILTDVYGVGLTDGGKAVVLSRKYNE